MATADSVKNKIQGLINTANATTGKADTDLTSAVGALIAGFGQGGGGGGGTSGIYMAKVTMAENVGNINVVHNLGTKDILFALCFAEDLDGITPENSNNIVAKAWMNTNINVRYGLNGGFNSMNRYDTENSRADGGVQPNSGSYWDAVVDENTFKFHRGISGYTYIAGITYTIIIMAKNAFSVTEG